MGETVNSQMEGIMPVKSKPRIDFSLPGRMISGSKRIPPGHPDPSRVVFNANVLTRSEGKIWYGDLDLTKDEDDLRLLAKAKGEAVYVLREKDARFMTESNPRWDEAVAIIEPSNA
jgi:hypothetical protein